MVARVINICIGLWLMIVPSVLAIPQGAEALFYILGPVIAAVAMISMSESVRNFRLVNVLSGSVLLLSPLFVDLPGGADLNNVATGATAVAAALIRGKVSNRFGGGWRALFQKEPPHLDSAGRKDTVSV